MQAVIERHGRARLRPHRQHHLGYRSKMPIPGLDLSSGARAGLTAFLAGVARRSPTSNVTINNLLPGKLRHRPAARAHRAGAAEDRHADASAAPARSRRAGQALRHAGGVRRRSAPSCARSMPATSPGRTFRSTAGSMSAHSEEVAPAGVSPLPRELGRGCREERTTTSRRSDAGTTDLDRRRRSISTNIRSPESWKSRRPSRSATSATWRSPIRRASPLPAWRSATIRQAPPTNGRANLVAVISNGTAVLGLGDIGPLAAKPVMEGKAVLFKKFAGIDVFDIEIDAPDDRAHGRNCRRARADLRRHQSGRRQGAGMLRGRGAAQGANEDSGLPRRPAWHRDHRRRGRGQRAGTGRQEDREVKIVTSGAGAAALACLNLLVSLGARRDNIWVTDRHGVAYEGRVEEMDRWKDPYVKATEARSWQM